MNFRTNEQVESGALRTKAGSSKKSSLYNAANLQSVFIVLLSRICAREDKTASRGGKPIAYQQRFYEVTG